jgi:hypothetical protein
MERIRVPSNIRTFLWALLFLYTNEVFVVLSIGATLANFLSCDDVCCNTPRAAHFLELLKSSSLELCFDSIFSSPLVILAGALEI